MRNHGAAPARDPSGDRPGQPGLPGPAARKMGRRPIPSRPDAARRSGPAHFINRKPETGLGKARDRPRPRVPGRCRAPGHGAMGAAPSCPSHGGFRVTADSESRRAVGVPSARGPRTCAGDQVPRGSVTHPAGWPPGPGGPGSGGCWQQPAGGCTEAPRPPRPAGASRAGGLPWCSAPPP